MCRTCQTRRHSPAWFARTRQTCQHSPTQFAHQTCESQVLQVLIEFGDSGEFGGRIQRVQARSFYTNKICYLCLKQPTLSCANICRGLASTWQVGKTRRHSPTCFSRTRQTRRHSPKAIFKKNVTCLDTFARVMSESHKFGASGHCLGKKH